MELEKVVNNTSYSVIKRSDGLLDVKASIGVNGVQVLFCCLETEFDKDFDIVRHRLIDMISNSLKSI